MRTKGSPNKPNYNSPGQLLTDTIKLRVSEQWLDVLNKVLPGCNLIKGKSQSEVIRYLVIKGLLSYCKSSDIEIVQDQLLHH